MKIRLCLVSNSSSSSFTLVHKGDLPEKIRVKMDIDPSTIIEDTVSNLRQLRSYMAEEYGSDWQEDVEYVAKYKLYRDQLDLGNTLSFGSVSSDSGNPLEYALYEMGIKWIEEGNPSITVLEDD